MLIYAQKVRHLDKWLAVAALDLSGTLDQILARVEELAGRIVDLRNETIKLRGAA